MGRTNSAMSMQGIDISHWQEGLNLHNVACDFVIVKLTQGHAFVDECAAGWIKQARELGKPWGIYHYIDGSGAQREVEHFLSTAKDYIGLGILCLDWEKGSNSAWANLDYLNEMVRSVIDRTGVAPFIYASWADYPWTTASTYNCPKWIARYRNNQPTSYQDNPWKEDEIAACEIRQYSENGTLASFDSTSLDLDKAYISAEQWAAYANPATPAKNSVDAYALALAVVKGEMGNGKARKAALGDAYTEVQAIVNRCFKEAHKAMNGRYGNGAARKAALGDDYAIVQWIINNMLA